MLQQFDQFQIVRFQGNYLIALSGGVVILGVLPAELFGLPNNSQEKKNGISCSCMLLDSGHIATLLSRLRII